MWLSIPVEVKGKYFQKINETKIVDSNWGKNHWATIKQFYNRTPFFKDYKEIFEQFYLATEEKYLSVVNRELINIINEVLQIKTKISWSGDYTLEEGKTERLVSLIKQAKGLEYISGPAAKDYINESLFNDAGIKLSWMDYSGYAEYTQQFPPFEHGVSILDLLFNEGNNARSFMKSFN